jgi:hypothetical protein
MKKVFLTGVIALGLGLMSFTNNSKEKVEDDKNGMCNSLALTVFNEVAQDTGDIEGAHSASMNFYNWCVAGFPFHN